MNESITVEASTTDVLLLALLIQCLAFATALLTTKRGSRNSNLHLAILLLVFSIQMLFNLLEGHNIYFVPFSRSLSLAYGPLVLLYTRSVIQSNDTFIRNALPHFIPMLIGIGVYYFTPYPVLTIGLLIFGHFMAYMVYAFRLVLSFYKRQKQVNPNRIGIALQWIIELFAGIIIIMAIALRFDVLHTEFMFNTLVISLFLIINMIGFRGVLKPNLFLGIPETEVLAAQDISEKYIHSQLSEAQVKEFAQTIKTMVDNDRPYLDENMSLASFAASLNLSSRVVSQVINQSFNKNFSDFINEHRLEYAKALLVSTTNMEKNISEVIHESGFNSKTRFYTFFKERTGLSPKAYREQHS